MEFRSLCRLPALVTPVARSHYRRRRLCRRRFVLLRSNTLRSVYVSCVNMVIQCETDAPKLNKQYEHLETIHMIYGNNMITLNIQMLFCATFV